MPPLLRAQLLQAGMVGWVPFKLQQHMVVLPPVKIWQHCTQPEAMSATDSRDDRLGTVTRAAALDLPCGLPGVISTAFREGFFACTGSCCAASKLACTFPPSYFFASALLMHASLSGKYPSLPPFWGLSYCIDVDGLTACKTIASSDPRAPIST